jgi:DNA mismatch repair protein MutL
MPYGEVDVNVHPSKTEVRFRQQTLIHDFVRDAVRAALSKARPIPQFVSEIHAQPKASASLTPGVQIGAAFALQAPEAPALPERLQFGPEAISVEANAAVPVARFAPQSFGSHLAPQVVAESTGCDYEIAELPAGDAPLASLKPVGQIRESFILAVNGEGLWIIDQHVAHERVLFEKVLKQRAAAAVETQQLLMPLIVELTPGQQAVFTEIVDELHQNGFEVEPFGSRTFAIKSAPAGIRAEEIEHTLNEVLDSFEREQQVFNLEHARTRIAATIACHAAIKVNMPLTQDKMEWLLAELAKTEHPMTCPHGRPIVLRYSVKDIQKAFKRI